MPQEPHFKDFGIVMSVVCLPFFILIGSLNTTSGMTFWRDKWHRMLGGIKRLTAKKEVSVKEDTKVGVKISQRSHSTSRAINIRKNQLRRPASSRVENGNRDGNGNGSGVKPPEPAVIRNVTNGDVGERSAKESGVEHVVDVRPEKLRPALTWREALFGRKKKAGSLGHFV